MTANIVVRPIFYSAPQVARLVEFALLLDRSPNLMGESRSRLQKMAAARLAPSAAVLHYFGLVAGQGGFLWNPA